MSIKLSVVDTCLSGAQARYFPDVAILQTQAYNPKGQLRDHGFSVLALIMDQLGDLRHQVDLQYVGAMDSDGACSGLALYRALSDIKICDILNMSLALPSSSHAAPLDRELMRLFKAGSQIFAAAYNAGSDAGYFFHSPYVTGIACLDMAEQAGLAGQCFHPCLPLTLEAGWGGATLQGTSYTTAKICGQYCAMMLKSPAPYSHNS